MPIEPYLHHRPLIGERAFVHPTATVIGDTHIGDDVSVWPNVSLRGDVNSIRIGRGTNIQDNAVGHVTHRHPGNPEGAPLVIGEFVTIGHAAVLHGCTIGDECLVGMGAIVLDNAVLEDRVFLAAGSLVSPGKRLESGWLYRGSPATKARPLTDEEIEFLRYSAEHYIATKNHYLTQESGEGAEGADPA
ncbi:MAG: gamma carbonic anhydrase family protein [Armatimonadota bacterium]